MWCVAIILSGPVGQYQGRPHLTPGSRLTPEVQGKLFIPTLASLFVEITKKNLVPLSSREVFLIFCVLKLFFNWIKGLAYLHALSGLVTVPIGLAASWGTHSWNREDYYYYVETWNDSDWEQRVLSPLLEGDTPWQDAGLSSEHRGEVMGFSSEPGNVSKPKLNGFLTKPSGFDYLGLPLTFTFLHKVSLLLGCWVFHFRYSAENILWAQYKTSRILVCKWQLVAECLEALSQHQTQWWNTFLFGLGPAIQIVFIIRGPNKLLRERLKTWEEDISSGSGQWLSQYSADL